MAEIAPFQGILYNPKHTSDFSQVVAPPYDVLSKAQVEEYHARSPYNITHLTRPSGDDPYAHAARLLRQWMADGILRTDPVPALYVYQQKFTDPETGGAVPERVGIICALRLEEYGTGKVIPHENTITAHRADRLRLMNTTHANLESIYGLYSDPDRSVESLVREIADREPVIETVAEIAGSTHRLERIADGDKIAVIASTLRDKPIFIADGHHRYETALAYRSQVGSTPLTDYIMITLTAFEDEGLLVLPTHRMVRDVDPERIASLRSGLSAAGFEVTPIAEASVIGHAVHPYGFVLLTAEGAWDVTPMDVEATISSVPGEKSHALKSLNVTILHAHAIEALLAIPIESLATTDKVSYTRDAREAVAKVKSGDVQAAFLLARPTVEQVQAVAAEGEKMPQKSTFFFPKLLSGLVLRDLT